MKRRTREKVTVLIAVSLAATFPLATTMFAYPGIPAVQDDAGFIEVETWDPELPTQGNAPQSECNGFVTRSVSYEPVCSDCWWAPGSYMEQWLCDCDMTRQQAPESDETWSFQWEHSHFETHFSVSGSIPAGGSATGAVNAEGHVEYQIAVGTCSLEEQ